MKTVEQTKLKLSSVPFFFVKKQKHHYFVLDMLDRLLDIKIKLEELKDSLLSFMENNRGKIQLHEYNVPYNKENMLLHRYGKIEQYVILKFDVARSASPVY